MRTLLLALVPTVSLVVFLAGAQNPRPPEPQAPKPRVTPEVRVTLSEAARKESARMTKTMQGLWVLKALEWANLEGVSSEFRGFCLVSGDHLNFEVHIGLKDSHKKLNDVMLDCGLWRFEVGEGNRMVLTSLIGSFIDKDNRVAFREEGTLCRYDVLAVGEQMVWRKDDGQRLVFERLASGAPPRVDIYGRPLPEPTDPDAEQPPGAKPDSRKPGGG
jgi:hypothetical protein